MNWLARFALILGLIGAVGSPARPAQSTIKLSVDATDAPRHLIHAKLTIPVKPGPLALFYPKWIPGHHRPAGPIVDVVGLEITGGGKVIAWKRDLIEMYEFHVDVPPDISEIQVTFDYICSPNPSGRTSHASATTELAILEWNEVLLYPESPP